MSLTAKMMIYIVIYTGLFVSVFSKFGDETHPAFFLIPLISYLTIFFVEAKSRINKGLSYDKVWKGCFWISFWFGATFLLPLYLLILDQENLKLIYIAGNLFQFSVFGGIAGLIGIVLINQFYGRLGGSKDSSQDGRNS